MIDGGFTWWPYLMYPAFFIVGLIWVFVLGPAKDWLDSHTALKDGLIMVAGAAMLANMAWQAWVHRVGLIDVFDGDWATRTFGF